MSGTLFHVLLALAAVILLGRLLGMLLARLGQPPVIGEVLAGILLGPSLLGRAWPEAMQFLLPADVVPHFSVIGPRWRRRRCCGCCMPSPQLVKKRCRPRMGGWKVPEVNRPPTRHEFHRARGRR